MSFFRQNEAGFKDERRNHRNSQQNNIEQEKSVCFFDCHIKYKCVV